MTTITLTEFKKELDAIEVIQKKVSKYLDSYNFFIKLFGYREAVRLDREASRRLAILTKKDLIPDTSDKPTPKHVESIDSCNWGADYGIT